MRGFIDYGLFYHGDTARETILRTASRMRRIIKRGFLTIFGKLTADGWILPNAPVPWKKQSAVLRKSRIPFDWIFLSSHRIIS